MGDEFEDTSVDTGSDVDTSSDSGESFDDSSMDAGDEAIEDSGSEGLDDSGDSGMDRAADIVEYRGLTKSHVSVAVKELCRRGLLGSRQDDEDRRAIHLKPTAAAVQIVEDGKAAQKANISKLFEGFTPEEKQQWCKLIKKMGSNVMNMIQE